MKSTSAWLQIGGRLEAQLEIPIARAARGKRLELHEQRRHEVERHLDVGKLPQERHHAVVVLQGVQPDPRQDVLARGQVLVKGLVHVPEDRDLGHQWYSVRQDGQERLEGGRLTFQPSCPSCLARLSCFASSTAT